jgi:hypothetical protein
LPALLRLVGEQLQALLQQVRPSQALQLQASLQQGPLVVKLFARLGQMLRNPFHTGCSSSPLNVTHELHVGLA